MSDQEDRDGLPDPASQEDSLPEAKNSLAGAALAQAAKDDPEAFEILRREWQSTKDKGVSEATKKAEAALSLVEQLAKHLNVPPEQVRTAQRNMVLDQLVQERMGADSADSLSGEDMREARRMASSLDYLEALNRVGASPNSLTPEDYDFIFKFQGSQVDLQNALLKRVAKRQPKAPSPGGVVSPSGGAPPSSDVESAMTAYISNYKAALERGDRFEADRLRREGRAKGLPVDNVIWELK